MVANLIAVPLDILYKTDFVEWTEEMANLIESRRTEEFDWVHLADEVRDLGTSQRSAVRSHLSILLQHLVKWEIQSGRRCRSWEDSISNARTAIDALTEDIPSLGRHLADSFDQTYEKAARRAFAETRLPASTQYTRWSKEQVLDPGFLPK